MSEMNITFCKYLYDEMVSANVAIKATIGGITMSVPLDPANRHYAEIMRQVEAGTLTIEPAESE